MIINCRRCRTRFTTPHCPGCGLNQAHALNYGVAGFDEDFSYAPWNDNTGQVGIDTSGDLTVGIGNGMSIDTSDGDLVIGGIDTGIDLF